MNERIKELRKQVKVDMHLHDIEDIKAMEGCFGFEGGNKIVNDYVEKFAELIVAECMKVAVNKDSGYIHPADVAGYMAAGRSTAAQMIRQHFGVEE